MVLDENTTSYNKDINYESKDNENSANNEIEINDSNIGDIQNSLIHLDKNIKDSSSISKNLTESNQVIKSSEKNENNEYKFNKPIQNFCLTNVTDDIKSLKYYVELLNTPRAKIKDVDLLKIKNENKNNSNYIIPSGFQLITTYPHRTKKIKLVLTIPSDNINSIIFVTIDDSFLNFWKGNNRFQKIFIPGKKLLKELNDFSRNINIKGKNISGTQIWLYIESLKLVIVSTINIEIKVWYLEQGYGEEQSYSYQIQEKVVIDNLDPDAWITNLYIERKNNILYAASDVNLYKIDMKTWEKKECYKNLHEIGITCLTFYQPLEYLITGGKDGKIKLWTSSMHLVHEFSQHFGSITGLLLLEDVCEASFGTLPILLSASEDATIRMFNFDTMMPIYRIDNPEPCKGLYKVKKDVIYHYSDVCVYLWNINKFYNVIVETSSKVICIKRIDHITKPARIVVLCYDGTIRILSPVNGAVILTLFPPCFITNIIKFLYDYDNEILYSFSQNGHVIVYDTTTNPALIKQIWKYNDNCYITSVVGISLSFFDKSLINTSENENSKKSFQQEEIKAYLKQISDFFIIAGTNDGQIVYFNKKENGEKEKIVQAHSGEICDIHYDECKMNIISSGKDYTIKIWKIYKENKYYTENASASPFQLLCIKKIDINPPVTIPVSLAIDYKNSIISFPISGYIEFVSYKDLKPIRDIKVRHSNITASIISIIYLKGLDIFISTSNDNVIRIWDKQKNIIREIQFIDNIHSICFLNAKGDLLIGLENQLDIIKAKDYLPLNILQKILTCDIVDDIYEPAISFDETIDFWDYFYNEAKVLLTPDFQWHIKKNEYKFIKSKTRNDKIIIKKALKKDTNKDEISIQNNKENELQKEFINSSENGNEIKKEKSDIIENIIYDKADEIGKEKEVKQSNYNDKTENNNTDTNEELNNSSDLNKESDYNTIENDQDIENNKIFEKNNQNIDLNNNDENFNNNIKNKFEVYSKNLLNIEENIKNTEVKHDIINEELIDYLPNKNCRSYSEYLNEVEKRKQLIDQFKQPDLILPNSKFLDELYKNGKLHGKTWEECMKGWYDFYYPKIPYVFNQKTKKYEYVGIDLRYKDSKQDSNNGEKEGSNESVFENKVNLELILGKEELDNINNINSKTSLFNSYERIKRKKQLHKNKKKNKHRKGNKHKNGTKQKDNSNHKNGMNHKSKKMNIDSDYERSENIKAKINRKQTKTSTKGSQDYESYSSFKLKSFGSNEKSNLIRNLGFDSLFDSDLNDDEITDAIFNTIMDYNEVDENQIAEEINNLNISENKKKAILDKLCEKLSEDQKTIKNDKIKEQILNKAQHFFLNTFDPLEDVLYKMSTATTKKAPLTINLINENKKMIDAYLENGGNLRSLKMNENGEICIDENGNGEIFQYELNNIYQQELKKKKDFKNYYKKGANSINYSTNPNTFDALKEISGNKRKSSDIAWNIVRQWKTDKKIDFKFVNNKGGNAERKQSILLTSKTFIGNNFEGDENVDKNKLSEDKKSDLNQIINNLMGITKTGLWSEKCEASKALLFIYNEFHSDLKISSSHFLLNQLELFSDDSWKVRAQMCANLIGYDYYNKECLKKVIGLLKDNNQDVRNIALQALCFYGISTKDKLNEFMKSAFKKEIKTEKKKTLLDQILEEKINENKKEEASSSEKILYWIRKVDPNTHSKVFRRMPSYFQHLVTKYDNREVKLSSSNEIDENEKKLIKNSDGSTENTIKIQKRELNEIKSRKQIINSITNNTNDFNSSNSSSIKSYTIDDDNDNIIDDNSLIMNSYNNNDETSFHHRNKSSSLIPLENKAIYNVVESTNSKRIQNNGFFNNDGGMIYNKDIYKIKNKTNSNNNEEKEEKEILKMPSMSLSSSSINNQQLQSSKINESIILPSVT
ncbi:hypothetical protein BCR36DRAFT_410381 [Piromyces finnis]|uniref:WD40 repeat-like protein n=1 Tax=Piromyces finnis TaxID=1754191 RepID=A0A1Y1VH37_9FUNG|nr:hypothetical protein BCR36DRAFT_410381 [Piromyces finnis]|eukprot:ORX55460.1 hypothetical protein BCR36DRAFT_410381 [Piromyces finnis]